MPLPNTFSPPRIRRTGSEYAATIALGAGCEITALGKTADEARSNVRILVDVLERGGHPAARREAERIARGAGV